MLYDDLVEVYEAFFWIGASRQFNDTGPQPITLTDIVTYLNDQGIQDRDERREFQRLIRALDVRFIKLSHEKMAKERERLSHKASSRKAKK